MRGGCVFLVVCVWSCIVSAQLSPAVKGLVNIMESMRNASADPCTDFFAYACGTYVATHPIPANVTAPTINLPSMEPIGFSNDALLAKIVNDPWPFVNDVYLSCMQDPAILEKNFISSYLSTVQDYETLFLTNTSTNATTGIWSAIQYSVLRLVEAFVGVTVEVDAEQQPIIMIQATGASLQPSGYSNPAVYKPLLMKVTEVLSLFENSSIAYEDAVDVLQVEHFIAQCQSVGYSQNYTLEGLVELFGKEILSLLTELNIVFNEKTAIIVEAPNCFNENTNFTQRTMIRYFQWRAFVNMENYNISQCMNTDNSTLTNMCGPYMSSSPYSPPWDQASVCRNFVHFLMPDLVGLIFTYEVITPATRDSIHNMTVGIQQAFNKSLPTLSWLDDASLENVVYKLDHILQIIGHPDVMDRYDGLITSPTDFMGNVMNVFATSMYWWFHDQSAPFNRTDFQFDPMVINAFYSPNTNTINFPAGMLESPMFSGEWPKFFQYGRMGLVVGHENTHGFDNHGSNWNAFGLPGNIFDDVTRAAFIANSQCIANYYSQFVVFGDTTVNGNNTLGENIADIGGTKNTFRAYQAYVAANGPEFQDYELISDLTVDQTFFLFMGQTWCSTSNQAYLEMQIQYDVHSPAKFRVLGPLSQFDEFAAAYNCPANTPMNPSSRCNLW